MDTSGLFRVDGMVAVVTGGGSGIGLMMTKALAGAGAKKVYILGRRKDVLEQAAASHPSIVPIACDVCDKRSLQAAVDFVARDAGGYVNLLVANSGIIGPETRYSADKSVAELRRMLFDDVAVEDFTATLNVNVTGAYFTLLAFLELLDAGNQQALLKGSGEGGAFGAPSREGSDVPSVQSQAIFTTSIGAYSRFWPSTPAYGASKAAIAHLAKHASTNLANCGIRVNALAPGSTGLIKTRDPSKETIKDDLFIPARRFGDEEDMAGAILYLASRAGAYCNGLALVPDGGKLSVMPSEY